MKPKLAIIGASDFQKPLILKAKEMGIETHVFAWESGAVGKECADYFYPISITEVDEITAVCRNLGIDGVCSIGTDLGNVTVAHVAAELGLTANSIECVHNSTNKSAMRQVFKEHGDPSPFSMRVTNLRDLAELDEQFPMIVKPVDRSGSRCVSKIYSSSELEAAVEQAINVSFEKAAVVEEFMEGLEYSVEYVSWNGVHKFLALTRKFTTGAPHFIETGHVEPAPVNDALLQKIQNVVEHALDSLGVRYGASHSEIIIDKDGVVRIVEIGSRMGGDCIGSHLVPLSTGVDFMRAVIDIALGREPDYRPQHAPSSAMIRFVFTDRDVETYELVRQNHPEYIVDYSFDSDMDRQIVDSSSRYGFYILRAEEGAELIQYYPEEG